MTEKTNVIGGYAGLTDAMTFTHNGTKYAATRQTLPTRTYYECFPIFDDWGFPILQGAGDIAHHEVLHPVADGTQPSDINGATIAEVKDGAWHFRHTAPATHHDHAEQLVSFIRTKFIPIIETLLNKVLQANSASVQAAREKLGRMRDYRDAIEEAAIAYLETKPLGYRQIAPFEAHLRNDYTAVLTSVYALWEQAGGDKAETANLALSSVALKKGHSVRTRLEIEADKAAQTPPPTPAKEVPVEPVEDEDEE